MRSLTCAGALFWVATWAAGLAAEEAEDIRKEIEELKRTVEELEERQQDLEDNPEFPSRLGEQLSFGGELELEYVDTENHSRPAVLGRTDEPEPHFQIDHLRLIPRIDFTRELRLQAQINIQTNRARLKEAFLRSRNLELGAWTFEGRLGLDDRFMKPNRRTENYPILGTAFWRDEAIGFFWEARVGDRDERWGELAFHLSLTNGYELALREIGEDEGLLVPGNILHEDRKFDSFTGLPETGLGLSYEKEVEGLGRLAAMAFGYWDELSTTDVAFLQNGIQSGPVAYTSNSRHRSMAGIQGQYRLGDLRVFGQYITAADGKIDRWGWYVQASYEVRFPEPLLFDKYLHRLEPLIRHERLEVQIDGVPRQPALSETWDWERWAFALIARITRRNIRMKLEYVHNDEHTGGGGTADNDEFLLQLELLF